MRNIEEKVTHPLCDHYGDVYGMFAGGDKKINTTSELSKWFDTVSSWEIKKSIEEQVSLIDGILNQSK